MSAPRCLPRCGSQAARTPRLRDGRTRFETYGRVGASEEAGARGGPPVSPSALDSSAPEGVRRDISLAPCPGPAAPRCPCVRLAGDPTRRGRRTRPPVRSRVNPAGPAMHSSGHIHRGFRPWNAVRAQSCLLSLVAPSARVASRVIYIYICSRGSAPGADLRPSYAWPRVPGVVPKRSRGSQRE